MLRIPIILLAVIPTVNTTNPSVSVEQPCAVTLRWVRRCLVGKGFKVLQTFDLNAARRAAARCPCPHHGTKKCNCQMVVLLVYGQTSRPVSLILHGNDGKSWLSIVDVPAKGRDASLYAAVQQALQLNPAQEGL